MELSNGFMLSYIDDLYPITVNTELKFSAHPNYVIQKNFKTLYDICQELDKERSRVISEYSTGIDEEKGIYLFEDEEKRVKAEKELNDLFNGTQEVNITQFPIESLGDMVLSTKDMSTLMLMIKE